MNYKHFLITRFNLSLQFGCEFRDPDENPTLKILDEDYLEKRFEIFEKYTLKSISEQTVQDFTWIILFHKRTPDKFLKRILDLKKIYDFEDLYLDENELFYFSQYCAERGISSDFYITSRIENDDMIDKDYMKLIHDYADENLQECFISFVNGAKLDLMSDKMYSIAWRSNHFITLVNSSNDTTVFDYIHSKITQEDVELVSIRTEVPMWIELIHETNIFNRITPRDKLIDK